MDSSDVEQRIKNAIEDYQSGKISMLSRACREWGVPVGRVRSRMAGHKPIENNKGGNGRLSDAQELAVCQYVERLSSIGLHPTLPMIRGAATAILRMSLQEEIPLEVENRDETIRLAVHAVDEYWTRRFMARHPEFSKKKTTRLSADRSEAHDVESIRGFFYKWKAAIEDNAIQLGDVYNFDETGF